MDLMRYVKDPLKIYLALASRGVFNWLPDEPYLKLYYRARIGKKLDLDSPKTYNEKLQWLKLYDRNPEYVDWVDKYEVKKLVADRIGQEYVIPTLGVWDRFEDIDLDALPNRFVLKCTHDSGGLVIVKDKTKLDVRAAKKKIENSLKRNYYYSGREWPYKNVKPRIIAEAYIEENDDGDLKDYKFMCFNGQVKCSFVCVDRGSKQGLHVTFFDRDWKPMPFERHYPQITWDVPKPEKYDELVILAEQLAKEMPFVRVDFYEVSGQILFGEMTFYPGAGFEEFTPDEWDLTLGSWLQLPEKR